MTTPAIDILARQSEMIHGVLTAIGKPGDLAAGPHRADVARTVPARAGWHPPEPRRKPTSQSMRGRAYRGKQSAGDRDFVDDGHNAVSTPCGVDYCIALCLCPHAADKRDRVAAGIDNHTAVIGRHRVATQCLLH